jgi:hypothetical protein
MHTVGWEPPNSKGSHWSLKRVKWRERRKGPGPDHATTTYNVVDRIIQLIMGFDCGGAFTPESRRLTGQHLKFDLTYLLAIRYG